MPQKICYVEVNCVEQNFVSFDFGSFAFIVWWDESDKVIWSMCSGPSYEEDFIWFLEDVDSAVCSNEFIKISHKDFQEAVAINVNCQTISLRRLRRFIKKVFPDHVNLVVN